MTYENLVTIAADGAVLPIIIIGGLALLLKVPKGGRYEAYSRILLAGLTAYLIAKLVGFIYQPAVERPFEILGVAAGASYLNNPGFPSDHTLFTASIVFAVWFETHSKSITMLLVLLTVIVSVGRVLALVHTPLDVIGGVIIASLGAVWYLQPGRSKSSRV